MILAFPAIIAAIVFGPMLWRYCFVHEPEVLPSTRKRIAQEHASSELIREQVEMPRGRRVEKREGPTGRYDRVVSR